MAVEALQVGEGGFTVATDMFGHSYNTHGGGWEIGKPYLQLFDTCRPRLSQWAITGTANKESYRPLLA